MIPYPILYLPTPTSPSTLINLHTPPMLMIKPTVSRCIGSPEFPLLAADAAGDDGEEQEGAAYA